MRRVVCAVCAVLLVGVVTVTDSEPAAGAPGDKIWEHDLASGNNRGSSPTIADVDGDGLNDIVYGDQQGNLRVLNVFGNYVPHWPQNVGVAIDSSPAVADLENDGANEIIIGVGSTWVPNQHGGVRIYNRDGTERCRYTSLDYGNVWTGGGKDGYAEGVFSSPSIGDVDGDGRMDVVFGGWDLHVHAIDRNCQKLSGFPVMVEDSTWSSPALYDSDDDGRLEIFIGSDQTPGGAPGFDWAGGEFRALDWQNGRVVELWKRRSRDVFHSSPAIGDINGDGRMEVVTGGGNHYNHPEGHWVWAFDLQTGANVAGWPQATGGAVFSSPALGDLDGNGVQEVVAASRDGSVYAWRGNGSRYWTRGPIPNCCQDPGPINASPIISDLDSDGDQDVAIGTGVGFHMLRGQDGAVMRSIPETGWSWEGAAAVGDFGPHGRRLVVGGFITGQPRHRIASYQLTSTVPSAWPMFQRDARHLGAPVSGGDPLPAGFCRRSSNPAPNPSPASGSGYWLMGRDGGIHARGAAQYRGSLPGSGVTTPAAGLSGRADGSGYWIVDDRGLVHSFGTPNLGDMRGAALNAPVIAIEPTPSGNGYWLLGRDGGIFTFGDAAFYGSTGGLRLNQPIIGMASTATGRGYWLLAADGGVFTFGDAAFYGSTGNLRLNAPVISMAVHPQGRGYWLLGADGGVFTFGQALGFHGSIPGSGICGQWNGVQIRASATGNGYWILTDNGAVFRFGDAADHGQQFGLSGAQRAVDMAVTG